MWLFQSVNEKLNWVSIFANKKYFYD